MKYKLIALVCLFASTAAAQLSDYLGPGILTHGAGDIGTRSGEQVALKFYGGVNAIYDNGLEPLSVDSKGNLVQVNGLVGVEGNLGVYGVHSWKQAQLGLDYMGDFRHYNANTFYDGSDQRLVLGLTYQKSRRLYFDFQEMGGTYSTGYGGIAGVPVPIPTVVGQNNSVLFSERTYFNETAVNATYLLTARTSVTVGGQEYLMRFQNAGLIGMNGYGANGSIQHRLSRTTSIGAAYAHSHYDYPGIYGQSDIDSIEGIFSTQFARRWTLSLRAGGYQAQVSGVRSVALDPAVAAVLGISSLPQTFFKLSRFPTGTATLSRQFKTSQLLLSYTQSVFPGNGVYLTSRNDNGGVTYSYTGQRKAGFSIHGSEYSYQSIGQGLTQYRAYDGGAALTYKLGRSLNIVARYDIRRQNIALAGFRQTSDRATLGLVFSPGTIPVSLW